MEEWKMLERFPSYAVSNTGKVKSFKLKEERILKQCETKDGYWFVCLSVNNKKFTSYIHRLVAEAFLELKDHLVLEGAVVNHIDKDPSNNNVENLEWVNMFHKADPTTYRLFIEIEKLCKRMNPQQLSTFVNLGNEIVQ
jgi:hypothetical protein